MTEEELKFTDCWPKITEVTSVIASEAFNRGLGIVSLDGKRVGINGFMLLMATKSEPLGPFVMNSVCARELCALLLREGFGPR